MAEPTREQIAQDYAKALTIIDGLRTSNTELLDACRRLLKFNEELCADVNVSTHYPSADFARAAIAKAERR